MSNEFKVNEQTISANGQKALEAIKASAEGLTIAEIAKATDLNPKSLPGLLNGLVKRGLLKSEKVMGVKQKQKSLTQYKILDLDSRFANKAGDATYNEKQEALIKFLADQYSEDVRNTITFTSEDLAVLGMKVAPATLTSLVNRGNLAKLPEKLTITVNEEAEVARYVHMSDAA